MSDGVKVKKEGSAGNEGIQQYYVNKIEELQVSSNTSSAVVGGHYSEIYMIYTLCVPAYMYFTRGDGSVWF